MQYGDKALPRTFLANPRRRFAFMCLDNIKRIRTRFSTEPISEWLC